MTEFRRASTSVDAIASLLEALTGASSGDGGTISDETRSQFLDAQKQLGELRPTVDKMRRKCDARAELEEVKLRLRELLPGTGDDVLKVAQEKLAPCQAAAFAELEEVKVCGCASCAGGDVPPTLAAIVSRADELDSLATYGAKMVEKILELLVRFDAVSARFDAEVLPRFSDAVASGTAAAEARRADAEREAAVAEEAEKKRLEEEYRRTVVDIMAQNEQKAQAQRDAQEAEERKLAEEREAQRLAEEASAAEEELFRQAELEGERLLAEVGPDGACASALATMLAAHVGEYREAVEALSGMISGIAAEPEDVRLRVVRAGNDGFRQKLGRRPGVWLFLRGVGFEAFAREALPQGLLAHLNIGTVQAGERFLWLKEPKMLEEYEEWQAWHARVKAIAGFLADLERLVFQRTAHLGRHGQDVAAQGAVSAAEVLQRWETRAS